MSDGNLGKRSLTVGVKKPNMTNHHSGIFRRGDFLASNLVTGLDLDDIEMVRDYGVSCHESDECKSDHDFIYQTGSKLWLAERVWRIWETMLSLYHARQMAMIMARANAPNIASGMRIMRAKRHMTLFTFVEVGEAVSDFPFRVRYHNDRPPVGSKLAFESFRLAGKVEAYRDDVGVVVAFERKCDVWSNNFDEVYL